MHVAVNSVCQLTFIFCWLFANANNIKSCAEIKLNGDSVSGVRTVYPIIGQNAVDVYCDQDTDGGGWTVIQKRDVFPERENFYRSWDEYARGFGKLTSEFWLGLENIHALTSSTEVELRVDLEDFEGEKRWAKYGRFRVGDSTTKYVLSISDYSGDAGDGFTPDSVSVNLDRMKFSTHDQDNDLKGSDSCAKIFRGAWWFNDCHRSHLNGLVEKGIHWIKIHVKKASMKIRPVSTTSKKFANCAEIKSNGDSMSGVRTVYPSGALSSKPVEVYCDQAIDEGGWTVFQSRSPVPVRERFERGWQEYVQGFGDLNGEFWLGLENIHALTTSSKMELRIDLEDYEGQKRWAKYGIFQVGDAASKYVLSIENYTGDAGDAMWNASVTNWKLNGMMFSTHDQDNDLTSSRNCALLYRGAWWFNNCHEAHLNGFPYTGKHDSFGDGINWDPFRGDQYSLKKASMKMRPVSTTSKNCAEIAINGDSTSGVRTVYPYGALSSKPVEVFCDQAIDGGGWTVIQSRSPGPVRERFERGWQEYVQGFGDLNGEFWLGLENIHALTTSSKVELRIDLEDYEGQKRWAKYGIFQVGDAASKYILSIQDYSGDAGDAMWNASQTFWHLNGMMFSTHDQDNDLTSLKNCALLYRGAWWFNNCHEAHLNGFPYTGKHGSFGDGINWDPFRGDQYSLKKANMKIRPVLSGS